MGSSHTSTHTPWTRLCAPLVAKGRAHTPGCLERAFLRNRTHPHPNPRAQQQRDGYARFDPKSSAEAAGGSEYEPSTSSASTGGLSSREHAKLMDVLWGTDGGAAGKEAEVEATEEREKLMRYMRHMAISNTVRCTARLRMYACERRCE